MKSAVFVSMALPVSSSYPISELIVIKTDNGKCEDIGASFVGTREKADGNLNQGISHGDKLGLCYKLGGPSDPDASPIADLSVQVEDKSLPEKCEKEFFEPVSTNFGANGDLNSGKHGKYIRLCQKLDHTQETAVTGVYLQSDEHCPSGYDVAIGSNGDNNLNQHGHSDGKNIFLCFKKEKCEQTGIKGYWKGLQEISKGNTFAHTIGVSVSHSKSWSNTVTNSVSNSNTQVQVNAEGASQSISSSNTRTVSDVVSSTFSYQYSESYTSSHTFTKTGYAWQYVTEVDSTCGTKDALHSSVVVLTTDSKMYPCCYPNRYYDLDDGSKCLTEDDILPNQKEDRGCTAHTSEAGRRRRGAMKAEGLDFDGAEVV